VTLSDEEAANAELLSLPLSIKKQLLAIAKVLPEAKSQ
jgi:hypothetical protein